MKKPSRKTLVKNLDTIFSIYIRRKDAINDIAECVTCGKKDHYKNLQCGHFMSRSNYSTRWDENNVGVQCYGCNITNQGMQYAFSKYLTKFDNNLPDNLLIKSKQIVKFADIDLIEMIEYYNSKLDSL